MAQRTGSRAVKKVRQAKKDKSSARKARVIASQSRSAGKAEYTDNESRSVGVKARKSKPNRSRPAAKAKITQSKDASTGIKAGTGKSTRSRSGGQAKSEPRANQPAASRAKSKMKDKQRASADAKGAKGKSIASRPGGKTKSASRAQSKSKSKSENKARASVKAKAAKSKPARSRPDSEAKAARHAGQPAASRPTAKAKIEKKENAPVDATETKAVVSRPRRKAGRKPRYLAAELGQPVDHEGEPIGAGSALLAADADLQAYSFRLWRQMLSGGGVKGYVRAIERAGFTVDEVWMVGISDIRSTSSTPDELRRYQQKMLFRANLLEAILSETVAELHRLVTIEPTPSDKAG